MSQKPTFTPYPSSGAEREGFVTAKNRSKLGVVQNLSSGDKSAVVVVMWL